MQLEQAAQRISSGGPDVAAPDAERKVREDLAAAYRLVAHFGMDDSIYTHISARVPGTDNQFLINPFGLHFSEVTASSLVKIDIDGNTLDDSPYPVNRAGFVQHALFHRHLPDAHCIMHTHTTAGTAVSSLEGGLQPVNFYACNFAGQIAYHDFEGVTVRDEEVARLLENLGSRRAMLLRNHGTLAVGKTAAEAWIGIFFLERACGQQVAALSAGRDNVLIAPDAAQAETKEQGRGIGFVSGLAWPGALRLLDRKLPGYDA